jgi:drug/metabolite transporter (DMT)-like permease
MFKGLMLLLLAEFSFALSTVFAKIVTTTSAVPAIELTFFRFLLGFIGIGIYTAWTKKSLRPKNFTFISLRAAFNTVAVMCFFMGIEQTTVTKANMLNMTYPVFVFLMAPLITGERVTARSVILLLFAIAGMYLVIVPSFGALSLSDINRGDLFSLLSGAFAAVAITSLRQARKSDETHVILFYLMLFGTVINAIPLIPIFEIPRGGVIIHVAAATAASVAGQVLITAGYRYIEAAPGSLVSSSRILFGLALGVAVFSDPLTARIVGGAVLILLSLVGLSGLWKKNGDVAEQ